MCLLSTHSTAGHHTLLTHLPHTCSHRSICCWGLGCEVYTRVVSSRSKNLERTENITKSNTWRSQQLDWWSSRPAFTAKKTLSRLLTASDDTLHKQRSAKVTVWDHTDLGDNPGGGHMVRRRLHPPSHFHCWGSYSASCLQQERKPPPPHKGFWLIHSFSQTDWLICCSYKTTLEFQVFFWLKPFVFVQTHRPLSSYISDQIRVWSFIITV